MATTLDQNRIWIIWISLFIALLLSIMPLPNWIEGLRPQWVALFLIYWVIALPQRIGIAHGFVCGFLLDILSGTTMGENALSLSIIAFISQQYHARLRVRNFIQQSYLIAGLLIIQKLVSFLVLGITINQTPSIQFWIASLISAALWPSIFQLLRNVRRRMHVR